METQKRSRKAIHRTRIREEIIEEFIRQRLDGADPPIKAVCEELGITKGTAYWHWTNKAEMEKDIVEYWGADRLRRLNDIPRGSEITLDALQLKATQIYYELSVLVPPKSPHYAEISRLLYRAVQNVIDSVLTPAHSDGRKFHVWLMGLGVAYGLGEEIYTASTRAKIFG